jgi:hypothetical protein
MHVTTREHALDDVGPALIAHRDHTCRVCPRAHPVTVAPGVRHIRDRYVSDWLSDRQPTSHTAVGPACDRSRAGHRCRPCERRSGSATGGWKRTRGEAPRPTFRVKSGGRPGKNAESIWPPSDGVGPHDPLTGRAPAPARGRGRPRSRDEAALEEGAGPLLVSHWCPNQCPSSCAGVRRGVR